MYQVYSQLYQAKFIGVEYNKELQWNISELIDELENLGVKENTIVIYIS